MINWPKMALYGAGCMAVLFVLVPAPTPAPVLQPVVYAPPPAVEKPLPPPKITSKPVPVVKKAPPSKPKVKPSGCSKVPAEAFGRTVDDVVRFAAEHGRPLTTSEVATLKKCTTAPR